MRHASEFDAKGVGETFLYWSKERLGRKPVISIAHVTIDRATEPNQPDVVVISTNVFATRYLSTSVSVTVLTPGHQHARRYLAYINRSNVDAFGGLFGGVVKWFVEKRLKGDAEEMLPRLRARLESGEPESGGPYDADSR